MHVPDGSRITRWTGLAADARCERISKLEESVFFETCTQFFTLVT